MGRTSDGMWNQGCSIPGSFSTYLVVPQPSAAQIFPSTLLLRPTSQLWFPGILARSWELTRVSWLSMSRRGEQLILSLEPFRHEGLREESNGEALAAVRCPSYLKAEVGGALEARGGRPACAAA